MSTIGLTDDGKIQNQGIENAKIQCHHQQRILGYKQKL